MKLTIVECFGEGGGECRMTGLCRLRGVLDEAVAAFDAVLRRYTLVDLVRNRDALSAIFFANGAARPHRPAKAPA